MESTKKLKIYFDGLGLAMITLFINDHIFKSFRESILKAVLQPHIVYLSIKQSKVLYYETYFFSGIFKP